MVATSVGTYAATARTLRSATDGELARITEELLRAPRCEDPGGFRPGARLGPLGGAGGFVQVVGRDGSPIGSSGATLPGRCGTSAASWGWAVWRGSPWLRCWG